VFSPQPLNIAYAGEPLPGQLPCYWRVRVWDQEDRVSDYSLPASFEIGILYPEQWQGKWIAANIEQKLEVRRPSQAPLRLNPPAPMLQHKFQIKKPVHYARAYIAALGYCELYLNDHKVGDRVLDPAYSNYHKRIYYSAYSVTEQLTQGTNWLRVFLGQGWWGKRPQLLLQLNVVFADGSRTSIVTDSHWHWALSPIVNHSIYHGETYDARKESLGGHPFIFWAKPKWQPVLIMASPKAILSPQMIPPIKVVETRLPEKITCPQGVLVYDFGQNFSGWCRLKVSAARGCKLILKHGELLYQEGTLDRENLVDAAATDTYIVKGKGVETYEPRFTYHGFRYVQVTLEDCPTKQTSEVFKTSEVYSWDFSRGNNSGASIVARVVHTALPFRGHFTCSNALLNQIHQNALWTFRSNFHSYPTDCPQRNERWGWLADAHITSDMALYNFQMEPAYSKFLQDIQDTQAEYGGIPNTVPHGWGAVSGDPMWAAAYPIILWNVYRHSGDVQLLASHYPGIRSYVDSLHREAPDGIVTHNRFGDWLGIVSTSGAFISTGGFLQMARIVAKVAQKLGKTEEAAMYHDLSAQIATAFNQRFFDPDKGLYDNGSQFASLFPLYLQIVPNDFRQTVLEHLVHDIMVNHQGHLSTGFIGTRYLLDTLVQEGRGDVAYHIVTQESYPGWGYMVRNGATTMWEAWDGDQVSCSHNHPPFAFVSGWFYSTLAGLIPDEDFPGWERFHVIPHLLGELTWVEASVDTLRGKVAIRWQLSDKGVEMAVTVPATSQATVCLPKRNILHPRIDESNAPVWTDGNFVAGTRGISFGQDIGDWVALEVLSGEYHFKIFEPV